MLLDLRIIGVIDNLLMIKVFFEQNVLKLVASSCINQYLSKNRLVSKTEALQPFCILISIFDIVVRISRAEF